MFKNIFGNRGGSDSANVDISVLANLPIEELAEKPIECLVHLPNEILAKLLAEMPSEKGARLLYELPASQGMEVLNAFAGAAISDVAGEDDSDQEDEYDMEDDSDDEDDDGDEDDDDRDDEEEDDKYEDVSVPPLREGIKAPVGKRVILRSDYKSNASYCEAVVKSMRDVLHKNGIRTDVHNLRPGVKVFAFDKTTHGVNIDCHILCEFDRCNYRIEFKFNVDNQPGRTPLIDYFCQSKNFPLRYGSLIMDHDDGEKKLEYSSCFRGAFSEETFATYFDLLSSTLKVYAADYAKIAGEKKLDADQRKVVKSMLGDLCSCLPARVKPENEEMLAKVVEVLGGHLNPSQNKLLNYIVERAK